ncbi:hypothetical protein I302_106793 [Kwoniella bestiolae CBS 10118]|uniref:DUF6534 domain-containing protein n=1 Tax=Kwoniella bestiolae CBS 10118 TaxID=1296100 RepID=A0A1B9G0D8_9TREE|nr:hypothetical protein I302_05941 [Kwoniella bestiolae CBS 10118]OCF24481.1 hypothetical protein I302_05941 [Kwoniella bestiolae CBS 10118]
MSLDITGMPAEQVEAITQAAFSDSIGVKLGPVLLGPIFDVILYGVMLQQFQCWWAYGRASERKAINWLTYYIMLASTAWSIMIISYMLNCFVYNFGTFSVFIKMPYATAFPSVGYTMSAAVQCFYIERSYRLNNRNIPLLILLIALVIGEFVAIVFVIIICGRVASVLQAEDQIMYIRAWQCLTLATDTIITLSLSWGLWKAKTGWSHTDALVKRLILITLETQLAPTLIMLGFVIEFSIFPASTMGLFFDVMIPKGYTVGYLATLNARLHLQKDRTIGGSGNGKQTSTNAYHLGSGRLQQATVQVDTQTYVESYQAKNPTPGVVRDNNMFEDGSVENLDYTSNLSKQNLNMPLEGNRH